VPSLPSSRKVALVALFTALAAVLNLLISVPDPGATFLFFEVWEIPILAVLLIMGIQGAATVAVLNALVLEVVKPGSLPTGPLYNLIAILSTFVGVLLAKHVTGSWKLRRKTLWISATVAGASVRTLVMTFVNWIVLPLPYPIGFGSFGVTAAQVPSFLVPIGIFNFIVASYSVPLAFSAYWALAARYKNLVPNSFSGEAI
jgi:riboflavin transporter FmnP